MFFQFARPSWLTRCLAGVQLKGLISLLLSLTRLQTHAPVMSCSLPFSSSLPSVLKFLILPREKTEKYLLFQK